MASISYRSLRQVGGGRLSALGNRPGELAGVCSSPCQLHQVELLQLCADAVARSNTLWKCAYAPDRAKLPRCLFYADVQSREVSQCEDSSTSLQS